MGQNSGPNWENLDMGMVSISSIYFMIITHHHFGSALFNISSPLTISSSGNLVVNFELTYEDVFGVTSAD